MTPSQIFAAMKALFENAELHALLGPLATAAAKFAANPTAINGVLQLAQLESDIIGAQPAIAQSELKLIADDLAAAAANLAPTVAANSATLAAKVAAAAAPAA